MLNFIVVGYVQRILGRGDLFASSSPHPWAAPKKPILNKIKIWFDPVTFCTSKNVHMMNKKE